MQAGFPRRGRAKGPLKNMILPLDYIGIPAALINLKEIKV